MNNRIQLMEFVEYRGMLSGDAKVYRYDYYKDRSFSVRLVKD